MLSKKTILLLLALHGHILGYAQHNCLLTFSGQVVDETHQPLIGASVYIVTEQVGQATDYLGNFRFPNLCGGRYGIKVQYVGYQDLEFNISVKADLNRTIQLIPLVTQLNEVVIQHHDASHTEHIHNFVQVNERQLAELAGKSLGESLKMISGVNSIQTGPGIFKPVIHGLHSQRVLILNHGIRQEGQQWGAEHAPEIDPFIASNIVVIKDASAIKYGTDALGGVIVVNPPELPMKAGLGGTFNNVLQSNGSSVTLSGMLEGGIRKHSGWGWRIQSTAKRTGDFETPDYSLTNTGVKEMNFSASVGYHKENAGFDLFFSHFQTDLGILRGTATANEEDLANAMERAIPEFTKSFSYKIQEPRQQVSHNLLKLNGHIRKNSGEWRWVYGFQNNNRQEFDLRIGGLSKIPAIDLQLNTHTLAVEWETHHTNRRTLSVGVNGMYQSNKNIPGTQRLPFIPNFNNTSMGVFGVSKFYLQTWTVDLGIRTDLRYYAVKGFDFKNAFYSTSFDFTNISGTAGATKVIGKNHILNLNLSSAWRPPHVAELYSIGTHQSAATIEYGLLLNDSTNEVMNIDDVNFETEQALKFVTTYQFRNEKFTFDISPYINYIFNYIYLRPEGITKTIRGVYPSSRYNQTNGLFLGADLTATWYLLKYFKVMPQVSLLRASDELNNDYFISIPSNRYEVATRYERPSLSFFKNLYLEAETQYISKQSRAPRVISPRQILESEEQNIDPFSGDRSIFDFMEAPEGYWLLNLSAGASIKNKKVQYDFRIASENILNQKYREYTNRFRYYADDLGRNIIFSFKCIF